MIAQTDRWQIPYVLKVKTYFFVSLIQQIRKNIDKGFFSKEYAGKIGKNLLQGVLSSEHNQAFEKFTLKYGFYPPSFCTISPTQKCNLQCTGCYAASTSKTNTSLTYAVVDRLVQEMHDIMASRFIVISGGEPFIWNDKRKDIIDLAQAYPDMFFQVYTNGLLLDDEKIKRLMAIANMTPAISVEGFESLTDERRGKGVFKKILKKMEVLKSYGLPFGVSVTVSKKNIGLLLDDIFYDYWFEKIGAVFMWMFHYMPIGRAKDTIELMISPSERKALLEKWEHLLFKKNYFVGDFWNSGAASDGCIAYACGGGYFHVNWKGNITPCVFVPYWKHNLNDLYRDGKSVMDAIMSDYFQRGRDWQKQQGSYSCNPKNHFAPCSIRDNHFYFRNNILAADINPEDENADAALKDPEYFKKLLEFDDELWKLTYPMWQERLHHGVSEMSKK